MAHDAVSPRVLPHDTQAEMGVLGSMMLTPEAAHLASERLTRGSFYTLSHQEIFEALANLFDERNTIDIILLRQELKQREKLEQVGGARYLTELMEAVPTSANAEHYVDIVRNNAVRRQLIETATGVVKASYEDGQDIDDLLDGAESEILAVRNTGQSAQLKSMGDLLKWVVAYTDQLHQHPGQLSGLATGFTDLNEITNGLQPGELVVVAARPSVGKTTLALNILHYVCMVERRPAALFTLEMGAEQIVSNFLCMHLRLDTQRFRRGDLKDSEWRDIEDSVHDMVELPLFIDDTPALRLSDLRARARRMHHQHGVELIVVDYMQLVRPTRGRDNRATEVAEISAGLKALARELEVPLLAVAQLNRSVDKESRQPRMSDLRESGAIEQDADVIMLLHRDDYGAEPDNEAGEDQPGVPRDSKGVPGSLADVIIAKQRNGPTGTCPLVFWKRCLRFEARSTATR
ncbi:MAG: replicative DNA helicase [Candidatus Brocadiia bacterium]|jgi:replicative DNA helicase|nr:replicative DNA helicase [Candidatus Brocadiia bacterium]